MRYPASEKLEIIRLVEQSHLPVRRTLEKLGIQPARFYRWYDRLQTGGLSGLDNALCADGICGVAHLAATGGFCRTPISADLVLHSARTQCSLVLDVFRRQQSVARRDQHRSAISGHSCHCRRVPSARQVGCMVSHAARGLGWLCECSQYCDLAIKRLTIRVRTLMLAIILVTAGVRGNIGYEMTEPKVTIPAPEPRASQRLSPNVIALGFVGMLTAMSSAMIYGLLPVFMVRVLGISIASVGIIEGMAESAASLVKIVSGAVSDRIGRRKPLVVFGYTLSAIIKTIFPVAGSASAVLAARVVDRLGKGIRDAPRDAFLADLTAKEIRGEGFGLRLALTIFGFVVGPLIAIGLMKLSGGDFRFVFWMALVPAYLSVQRAARRGQGISIQSCRNSAAILV